eukprot:TRINITY_DN7862_c0_g1_i2.p2 TRINITY_DN7862_c0_g1~~TRINITY_DN7862_c0_g1_i2.p2  ORF type:complete len:142 (+),score=38.06 TRINITY_DN7862_c0_g1_i2:100-525(+)
MCIRDSFYIFSFDALLLRSRENLGAMHGEQRLVGRHHVLAIGDGLHDHFLGHAVAADQLNDDVDFRIIDQKKTNQKKKKQKNLEKRFGQNQEGNQVKQNKQRSDRSIKYKRVKEKSLKKRQERQKEKNCLLYTSPSPRDQA